MPTFLTKLKSGQYDKKQWGVILLIGVLLVIIAMPTGSGDSQEQEEELEELTKEEISSISIVSDEWEYKTYIEEQLCLILSQVDGVGEVSVMITLQSTTEKLVEKDLSTSGEETEEETIYEENEWGNTPYVYKEIYPTIEGVVVTAAGGDNAIVIQNITEAIQALFDVDTHKIKIMKMITD